MDTTNDALSILITTGEAISSFFGVLGFDPLVIALLVKARFDYQKLYNRQHLFVLGGGFVHGVYVGRAQARSVHRAILWLQVKYGPPRDNAFNNMVFASFDCQNALDCQQARLNYTGTDYTVWKKMNFKDSDLYVFQSLHHVKSIHSLCALVSDKSSPFYSRGNHVFVYPSLLGQLEYLAEFFESAKPTSSTRCHYHDDTHLNAFSKKEFLHWLSQRSES